MAANKPNSGASSQNDDREILGQEDNWWREENGCQRDSKETSPNSSDIMAIKNDSWWIKAFDHVYNEDASAEIRDEPTEVFLDRVDELFDLFTAEWCPDRDEKDILREDAERMKRGVDSLSDKEILMRLYWYISCNDSIQINENRDHVDECRRHFPRRPT